ncbi:MAG: SDR family oxidoreductase [Planctomycetaceae bacterium]|nr:SDR family oxidoreductase [Planctomycetaceae bacterium]
MKYTDLTGKVAVVTGSARGIGYESAKMMAEVGAKVVISDINAEGAEKTAAAMRADGLDAVAIACDVSKEESVKAMLAEAAKLKGTIDILVNNAGILDPTSIPEMTVEKWDRMLAINLRGVQLCSQHAMPLMTKGGGGRIINMSSQGGQFGGFLAGVHYTAAKGGIIALTKAYARYCAEFQINVNCVAPGFMLTDMTKDRENYPEIVPLKRLGTALDAAKAVFFLATSLSDYITGATIDVNGGYYMRA